MLKILLALSMGVFCVSPLQAAEITPVTKSCEPGAKQAQCERWVTDIKKAVELAYKGDHGAQVTVAFCLSTGCHGAVAIDKVASCSWHLVIANSGVATVLDASNLRNTCRPMTPAEKDQARASSRDLVQKIYKRPMVATDQM
ncbi:hypothetical protein HFO93_14020 [Rhizobium leguminosarum]|uniref:hypothetical protein n=1 Tax=Rhizobium TaxID=379 RepID=UPI0014787C7C|nr:MULTISPECIES: hypothetical protein [Rhizobium]MBW8791432.1 hypothetical protein [Rhizobium leguminosarum]MBY5444579.1 hypothetical protein [Rhizobium leguminosarum]NNH60286.1 hypothetical protein [Rhizobium laguerreae]UWM76323.1 hypothetical protein N1937_03465 [Rhizobium leguminosarum bv. viciae]